MYFYVLTSGIVAVPVSWVRQEMERQMSIADYIVTECSEDQLIKDLLARENAFLEHRLSKSEKEYLLARCGPVGDGTFRIGTMRPNVSRSILHFYLFLVLQPKIHKFKNLSSEENQHHLLGKLKGRPIRGLLLLVFVLTKEIFTVFEIFNFVKILLFLQRLKWTR